MTKNVKQGWQCPICQTVYAPTIEKCECAVQQLDQSKGQAGTSITITDPGHWIEVPNPNQPAGVQWSWTNGFGVGRRV